MSPRVGTRPAALFLLTRLLAPGPAGAQEPGRPAVGADADPPDAVAHAEVSRGSAGAAGGGVRWFPPESAFSPLLAAPGEVGLRGSFVLSDRPDSDFEGRNLEAEVAIGHHVPLVKLLEGSPGRPTLVVGFEVGIFARFFMETSEKDLIDTDFRVGAPLSLRAGGWEGRLTVLHVSSHVGDDFLFRFPRPRGEVTRDGLEALVARRVGALRAYGGADLNLHANPGVERAAARAGLEWDPGERAEAGGAWPFAAADFQVTSEAERPAGTLAAGVSLRMGGAGLRLEARAHFGPSPIGQLRTEEETFFGVGLRVEPAGGRR